MIKKELLFMLEIDKFFDDYEKDNKKFKLLVEIPESEVEYTGNNINMKSVSILLKPVNTKKINITRSKHINSNNNLF